MNRTVLASLLSLLTFRPVFAAQLSSDRHLLVLKSGGVTVGVLPRLGGRVVLLSRAGGENVLLSSSAFWDPATPVPGLMPTWDYPPVNGHIVWCGPQKDWWIHQDIDAEKRARADNWPPDPYLEFAPFEVTKKSKTSVEMRGPASPVTGLRLTKRVDIGKDGRVSLTVGAENIRKQDVAGDLWPNTRLPGDVRVYVPLASGSSVKIDHGSGDPWKLAVLEYDVVDGFFTWLSREPIPDGKTCRVGKAFLTPATGLIAAFRGNSVFIKRFAAAARADVHPDQGVVEIFNQVFRNPAESFLEAEFHGAYRRLKPGETMEVTETWEVLDYHGPDDSKSHVAFLKGL
jgi:hypothetical protein